MTAKNPSVAEALGSFVANRLAEINTQIIARVESYDSSTQRCSAQPLIKRGVIDEAGERSAELLPIVTEVPVRWPGAGSAYSDTIPLSKGDLVWLEFTQGSLDRWIGTGSRSEPVDPEDDRRFALTDAVATPWATDPDVADGARVIKAPELRLGSKDASDAVQTTADGTTFMLALDAAITAMTSGGDPAVSALSQLKTALENASWPVGASKVKAE